MEKLNFKTWLEALPGLAIQNKIWLTWRFIIEAWIATTPALVVILWITLAFLLHKSELYIFTAPDIFPVFGTIAGVAAALIAESQLRSWKQEKLLDRLEALYLSADRLHNLCNSLLGGSAWFHASEENRKFTDSDIEAFIDAANLGYIDKDAITTTCLNMSHQILFIQKLLTNRAFKLHKSNEVHKFLNKTELFCARITRLADTIDLAAKHERGEIHYTAQAGIHKAILEDIQSSKESLNENRYGKPPENGDLMFPPHSQIKIGVFALIRTLRI